MEEHVFGVEKRHTGWPPDETNQFRERIIKWTAFLDGVRHVAHTRLARVARVMPHTVVR